jgi:hypothetical protein
MAFTSLFLQGLVLFAPIVTGAPADTSPIKQCIQLDVPVPVRATNLQYDMPRVDSSIDAIDWTVNVTTWSTKSAKDRVIGKVDINCTFTINAQLCFPPQMGAKSDILQIATPGNGFDKR